MAWSRDSFSFISAISSSATDYRRGLEGATFGLPNDPPRPSTLFTGGGMGSDLLFRIFVIGLGLVPVALIVLVMFMRL